MAETRIDPVRVKGLYEDLVVLDNATTTWPVYSLSLDRVLQAAKRAVLNPGAPRSEFIAAISRFEAIWRKLPQYPESGSEL
jgi:hypothetical protein